MSDQQEKICSRNHLSISDAIRCAEENLGFRGLLREPYWGTTRFTLRWVVGYQSSPKKRWRLDYSDRSENGKKPKFIHVNEENFENPPGQQKIVHLVESANISGGYQVDLLYRKWTSQYDLPEKVIEALNFEKYSRR